MSPVIERINITSVDAGLRPTNPEAKQKGSPDKQTALDASSMSANEILQLFPEENREKILSEITALLIFDQITEKIARDLLERGFADSANQLIDGQLFLPVTDPTTDLGTEPGTEPMYRLSNRGVLFFSKMGESFPAQILNQPFLKYLGTSPDRKVLALHAVYSALRSKQEPDPPISTPILESGDLIAASPPPSKIEKLKPRLTRWKRAMLMALSVLSGGAVGIAGETAIINHRTNGKLYPALAAWGADFNSRYLSFSNQELDLKAIKQWAKSEAFALVEALKTTYGSETGLFLARFLKQADACLDTPACDLGEFWADGAGIRPEEVWRAIANSENNQTILKANRRLELSDFITTSISYGLNELKISRAKVGEVAEKNTDTVDQLRIFEDIFSLNGFSTLLEPEEIAILEQKRNDYLLPIIWGTKENATFSSQEFHALFSDNLPFSRQYVESMAGSTPIHLPPNLNDRVALIKASVALPLDLQRMNDFFTLEEIKANRDIYLKAILENDPSYLATHQWFLVSYAGYKQYRESAAFFKAGAAADSYLFNNSAESLRELDSLIDQAFERAGATRPLGQEMLFYYVAGQEPSFISPDGSLAQLEQLADEAGLSIEDFLYQFVVIHTTVRPLSYFRIDNYLTYLERTPTIDTIDWFTVYTFNRPLASLPTLRALYSDLNLHVSEELLPTQISSTSSQVPQTHFELQRYIFNTLFTLNESGYAQPEQLQEQLIKPLQEKIKAIPEEMIPFISSYVSTYNWTSSTTIFEQIDTAIEWYQKIKPENQTSAIFSGQILGIITQVLAGHNSKDQPYSEYLTNDTIEALMQKILNSPTVDLTLNTAELNYFVQTVIDRIRYELSDPGSEVIAAGPFTRLSDGEGDVFNGVWQSGLAFTQLRLSGFNFENLPPPDLFAHPIFFSGELDNSLGFSVATTGEKYGYPSLEIMSLSAAELESRFASLHLITVSDEKDSHFTTVEQIASLMRQKGYATLEEWQTGEKIHTFFRVNQLMRSSSGEIIDNLTTELGQDYKRFFLVIATEPTSETQTTYQADQHKKIQTSTARIVYVSAHRAFSDAYLTAVAREMGVQENQIEVIVPDIGIAAHISNYKFGGYEDQRGRMVTTPSGSYYPAATFPLTPIGQP